jgi:hypothetical protein
MTNTLRTFADYCIFVLLLSALAAVGLAALVVLGWVLTQIAAGTLDQAITNIFAGVRAWVGLE